jgi:hypothetical protein
MDKKRVAGKLLYGVKYEPKVGGGKRTTYLKDGSGARAHTISYSDGCVTVYQHRDGRITGYHADSRGNTLVSRQGIRTVWRVGAVAAGSSGGLSGTAR